MTKPTKNYVEQEVLDTLEFEKPIFYDGRWIMKGKPDFTNQNKEFYQVLDEDILDDTPGLERLWEFYEKIHGKRTH